MVKPIYPLKGVIQHYAWGGDQYIPQLVNEVVEEGVPSAEYWMGAHPKAPAQLGEELDLNQLVASDALSLLGEKVYQQFGRLPYLFKVLDVKEMLSIQVHPTKEEAVKGFAKENEAGIPLDAPHRNYKDDNHKPEIMVALSEFWLLHGFLPEEALVKILQDTPEFVGLLPVFQKGGYKELYKTVMEMPQEEVDFVLQPLIDRALPLYKEGQTPKSSPAYWAAKSVVQDPEAQHLDRGIFSIYFFNIVRVDEGEAVFQDAGVPHAYLEGQNMELMANSDNVLRGGLTPKHIDVPELLKHTHFQATHPNIMHGDLSEDQKERVYITPAPDFELSKIDLSEGESCQRSATSVEIIIALKGEILLKASNEEILLQKGQCATVMGGASYTLVAKASSTLYRAKQGRI